MRLGVAILSLVLCLLGAPISHGFQTWQDLRFKGVVRQGQDFSCGVASLVSLINERFRVNYSEETVLLEFMRTLSESRVEDVITNGLTMADLKATAEALGFEAHAVRIGLIQLARTGHPAIVYVERDTLRHFVLFDGLDGDEVLLRDPMLGNRRMLIESFLQIWKGRTALFVVSPSHPTGETPRPRGDEKSTKQATRNLLYAPKFRTLGK